MPDGAQLMMLANLLANSTPSSVRPLNCMLA